MIAYSLSFSVLTTDRIQLLSMRDFVSLREKADALEFDLVGCWLFFGDFGIMCWAAVKRDQSAKETNTILREKRKESDSLEFGTTKVVEFDHFCKADQH